MAPTTCEGLMLDMGKKKPVTLVSTVVTRNNPVRNGIIASPQHAEQHDEPGQNSDQAYAGVQLGEGFKRQSENHGMRPPRSLDASYAPATELRHMIRAAAHSSGNPGSYLDVRMVSAVRT